MDRVGPVRHLSEVEQTTERLNDGARRVARGLRRPSLSPLTIASAAMLADTGGLAVALWFAQYAASLGGAFDPVLAGLSSGGGAVIGAALIYLLHGYQLRAIKNWLDGVLTTMIAGGFVLIGLSLLGLAQGEALTPPATVALALVLTPIRAMASYATGWALEAGLTQRHAVIVGGGEEAARVIHALSENAHNDIRICGLFDDRDDARSPMAVLGAPKLGGVAELVEFARIAEIDMVLISLPLSAERRILEITEQLRVLPVDVRLSSFSKGCDFPRRWRTAPHENGLIQVMSRPLANAQRAAKRAMDLVVASLAIIALSPVMLVTALAIRLESAGPVIFRQQRHGYNHKPVTVWKFRSMYADCADAQAVKVVTRGDRRVTRVGRFIRKTSIDELPQLFNVLSGRLSLVGPRPHALVGRSSSNQTFEQIVDGYSARHRVKPGITGWAQIHGWRGEIDAPEKLRKRIEHDLYYIENWSFWLDLRILIKTPTSLLNSENAY